MKHKIKAIAAIIGTSLAMLIPCSANALAFQAGDVNGDGQVNTTDAMLILRYLTYNITLTDEQLARADVNGNGVVNVYDAMEIIDMVS